MKEYLDTNWNYNSEMLVETYDELPIWAAPFGLKLLDGVKYRKATQAIDIGFGTGFPLTELAMRLDKSSKVYGIDPWEAGIKRARKKIDFYNISNIEIIRGVAEDISLPDSSMDLIVSNNGLNNVQNLDLSLGECSRILKSGGQFIQTMNLNESMKEFYKVMERVLMQLKLDESIEFMQKQIYNKRKPLEQYLKLIKSFDFEINSVLHDSFEYKFVDGTTMLNHHFIRLAFINGWKNIVPENRQNEVFDIIETELNKQSQIKGLIKLSIPFVVIDCKKL